MPSYTLDGYRDFAMTGWNHLVAYPTDCEDDNKVRQRSEAQGITSILSVLDARSISRETTLSTASLSIPTDSNFFCRLSLSSMLLLDSDDFDYAADVGCNSISWAPTVYLVNTASIPM